MKQFLNIMALILSLQVRMILVYAFRRVYLLKHVMQHSTNMFKLYQLVYLIFFGIDGDVGAVFVAFSVVLLVLLFRH